MFYNKITTVSCREALSSYFTYLENFLLPLQVFNKTTKVALEGQILLFCTLIAKYERIGEKHLEKKAGSERRRQRLWYSAGHKNIGPLNLHCQSEYSLARVSLKSLFRCMAACKLVLTYFSPSPH